MSKKVLSLLSRHSTPTPRSPPAVAPSGGSHSNVQDNDASPDTTVAAARRQRSNKPSLHKLTLDEKWSVCQAIFPPTLALLIFLGYGPTSDLLLRSKLTTMEKERLSHILDSLDEEERIFIQYLPKNLRNRRNFINTRARLNKAVERVKSAVTLSTKDSSKSTSTPSFKESRRLSLLSNQAVLQAKGNNITQKTSNQTPLSNRQHSAHTDAQVLTWFLKPIKQGNKLCFRHRYFCHHMAWAIRRLIQREVGPAIVELTEIEIPGGDKIEIANKYAVLDDLMNSLIQLNAYFMPPEEYKTNFQREPPAGLYVKNKCDACLVAAIVTVEKNLVDLGAAAKLRKNVTLKSNKWHEVPGDPTTKTARNALLVTRRNAYSDNRKSAHQAEILTWIHFWMTQCIRYSNVTNNLGRAPVPDRDPGELWDKSEKLASKIREIWRKERREWRQEAKRENLHRELENIQRNSNEPARRKSDDIEKWIQESLISATNIHLASPVIPTVGRDEKGKNKRTAGSIPLLPCPGMKPVNDFESMTGYEAGDELDPTGHKSDSIAETLSSESDSYTTADSEELELHDCDGNCSCNASTPSSERSPERSDATSRTDDRNPPSIVSPEHDSLLIQLKQSIQAFRAPPTPTPNPALDSTPDTLSIPRLRPPSIPTNPLAGRESPSSCATCKGRGGYEEVCSAFMMSKNSLDTERMEYTIRSEEEISPEVKAEREKEKLRIDLLKIKGLMSAFKKRSEEEEEERRRKQFSETLKR